MKHLFGEFESFEQQRIFARFYFWRKIKEIADTVIKDLADEPFNLYVESGYGNSNYPTLFRIPPTKNYFNNPELVIKFHNALRSWQLKFGFGYTIDDFPNLLFDEFFDLQFPLYRNNKENFSNHLDFLKCQNTIAPENVYKGLQIDFAKLTTEKHFEYRTRENDWILENACEFLHHWSLSSKDKETYFLGQSDSYFYANLTKPIVEFPIWCWQIQSKDEYAKSVLAIAKREIENSPYLSLAPSQEKTNLLEAVHKKILKYCNAEIEALKNAYPHLKPSRHSRHQFHNHFNWLIEICIFNQTAELRNKAIEQIAEREQTEKGIETRTIKIAVRNLIELLGLPLNKNFKRKKGRPRKVK